MQTMQCLSCGAPLNVGQGQRYVICEFCNTTADLSARPAPPRPGPANVGVPVGAANPYAQHFRQAQRPASAGTGTTAGARVALVIVAAVSLLLTVAGAGAAFFVSSAGPRASPIPGVTGGSRSPSGPLAKASYFNDATPVPGQIKAKFGQRLMLKRLVVYDEYVIFSAQNPQKPDNLDSYTLRNGSIDGGRPETFTGDQRKLEAELFSIDEIPFGSLAGLSRDALTRLQAAGVSDGKVTHIIVERENFGRGPGVILRPYVSSERRGGGYVEYDLRGNVKRVVGP
jgi:hypothetical protein